MEDPTTPFEYFCLIVAGLGLIWGLGHWSSIVGWMLVMSKSREEILASAYDATFNTEAGRVVLADIIAAAQYSEIFDKPPLDGELAYRAGKRDLATRILSALGMTIEDLIHSSIQSNDLKEI